MDTIALTVAACFVLALFFVVETEPSYFIPASPLASIEAN